MSKYTKTVANTPEAERASVLKSLKTNIHKHTGFGNVKDPSQSLPIDPAKSAGYSSQVIALAGQLKYQGEADYTPTDAKPQKFDDSFYLDYAQRKINIGFDSSYDKVLGGIDVAPDPKYAQYSYEEIIAMANNGVNIPKNVLAWAKGQQEADVVDYVVISDNSEFNGTNSQDQNSGESEISKIRAEVKDYAVKSKKAQEDITKNRDKTNEYENQAKTISQKQKNVFKNNSIDKTEEMTNEWKKLDKKKKEGSITSQEYKKYMQLSEKLSENSDIIKEMQKDSLELDNFLESIDNLNNETKEGLNTAQKTIHAADNLSNLDDGLNIFFRAHAYKIAASSSSLLEDNLNGINDIQLALVAEKIAHDLQGIGDETSNVINSSSTQETIDFADEYIHKAKHIENVLGIESYDDGTTENLSEDASDKDVEETKEKDKTQDENSIDKENNKTTNTEEENDIKIQNSAEISANDDRTKENDTILTEKKQNRSKQSEETNPTNAALVPEQQSEETNPTNAALVPEQQPEETNPTNAAQVPEQQSEETNPTNVTLVPEQQSEETNPTNAALVPEQQSEETNPTNVALVPEQQPEETNPTNAALVPEQQSEETNPTNVALVPEQQSEETNPTNAALVPEQQSEETNPTNVALVPEQQSEETNPTNVALVPEQQSEETNPTNAALVPEQQSEETNPTITPDTRVASLNEVSENETPIPQTNITEDRDSEIPAPVEQKQTTQNSDNFRDYIVQNMAMGKSPQEIIESYQNSQKFTVSNSKSSQNTKSENNKQTNNTQQTENNKQKEIISDPQAELKSEYGDNTNFVKLVVANNIMNLIGLGPSGFIFGLIKWAAIVGLSVLDLYSKKGIVDKSGEVANNSTKESGDATKALNTKSNQIKAEHEKNLAESKAYTNEFKTLDNASIDYQFTKYQEQMKLVEAGKMTQEQIKEFEDPNTGSKNAIRAKVANIEDKDAKLLATIKEPAAKADKIQKESKKSVNGFMNLNDKLTERNENNDKVGDVIIAESIIAQGIITALIATLLACGPWCWGLAAAWAVALVQNAAFAATGVAAKLVSNNVENKINENSQQITDNKKSLRANDKKMKDVRKSITKAQRDSMNTLPEEKQTQITSEQNPAQQGTPNETNQNEIPNNIVQENNDLTGNNASNSYVRKGADTSSGFNQSSLNAELNGNNPNDVQMANEYAKVYTNRINEADEKSRSAAAITNTDASSKFDTTDKADVKLARFNKEGAIDSKKRTQRVNAASSAQNHKNRK